MHKNEVFSYTTVALLVRKSALHAHILYLSCYFSQLDVIHVYSNGLDHDCEGRIQNTVEESANIADLLTENQTPDS
jgi:hypothetical protein